MSKKHRDRMLINQRLDAGSTHHRDLHQIEWRVGHHGRTFAVRDAAHSAGVRDALRAWIIEYDLARKEAPRLGPDGERETWGYMFKRLTGEAV